MHKIIECTNLGFVRDIPGELLTLEQQNTDLLKTNRFLNRVLIITAVGIGVLIIAEIVKTIKDENKNKRRSQGR